MNKYLEEITAENIGYAIKKIFIGIYEFMKGVRKKI